MPDDVATSPCAVTFAWLVRNGAGRALRAAPRSTCRSWAQAIATQAPNYLDGIVRDSTLTGKAARVVVLWERARDAFGPAPAMSMPMASPALAALVADAAQETGYYIG